MRTRISGKPKNITKKETRDILKWMARELRVDGYINPIFIDLKFIKGLKKQYKYRGSAIWEDDNHQPREFSLEVDADLSKSVTTSTLMHEMVHVKQYAKGQLKDMLRYYSLKKWGAKLVNEDKISYFKRPWEIEAHKLEKEYFQKWKEYKKRQ